MNAPTVPMPVLSAALHSLFFRPVPGAILPLRLPVADTRGAAPG